MEKHTIIFNEIVHNNEAERIERMFDYAQILIDYTRNSITLRKK